MRRASGGGFLFRLRLLTIDLPLRLRCIGGLFPLGREQIGFALYRAGHQRRKTGVALDRLTTNPSFSGGATPGVIDQPHGHAHDFVDVPAIKQTDRAETFRGFRIGCFPLALEIALQFLRPHLRHRDEADVRMLGGRAFNVTGVRLRERPLHV